MVEEDVGREVEAAVEAAAVEAAEAAKGVEVRVNGKTFSFAWTCSH